MTNVHVKLHPLRAEEGQHFTQVQNRMRAICDERLEKRKRTQGRYREWRRRRLEVQHRVTVPGLDGLDTIVPEML